jgi:hypothetical protein
MLSGAIELAVVLALRVPERTRSDNCALHVRDDLAALIKDIGLTTIGLGVDRTVDHHGPKEPTRPKTTTDAQRTRNVARA